MSQITLDTWRYDEMCHCHRCSEWRVEHAMLVKDYSALMDEMYMKLCPICGNKRCPKASDHSLDCTGSNAAGQPGSVYQ